MGKFLEAEKIRCISFKKQTPYLSDQARLPGYYRKKTRSFCLPQEFAEENLFEGIRHSAMDYFEQEEIKWHDGNDRRPSNHLCDSQVCCVNFLFPVAYEPDALVQLYTIAALHLERH